MRLDQAFDLPTQTVFFRQDRSDLIYAGCGVARECGGSKIDGLTNVEWMLRHWEGHWLMQRPMLTDSTRHAYQGPVEIW
jgi:hypothetical protein